MEQTGILKVVLAPENMGQNNTPKRTFVIEFKDNNYTKLLAFELWKDKTSLVSNLTIGQEVKVYFNIDSREGGGKYWTSCTAWKIEALSAAQPQPTFSDGQGGYSNTNPLAGMGGATPEETKDDLPF